MTIISACTTNKSELDTKKKEVKRDELKVESGELKVKNDEVTDKNNELKTKNEIYKAQSGGLKSDSKLKKKPVSVEKPNIPKSGISTKQESIKIPEKWTNSYSSDQKWLALYEETSEAFLTGWTNEFIKNPNASISREELLFAYRRRMEKIFYETPSFIEFCFNELGNSKKLNEFIIKFKSNVR
jgi:hypothetical protein